MLKRRHLRLVSLIVVIPVTLLLIISPSYALDVTIHGEAIPVGQVAVMVGSGSWQQFAKVMPIISGNTHTYRTGEGQLSLMLNDGTKLEAGKNTEFSVTGETSKNPIGFRGGDLTFSIPGETEVIIKGMNIEIFVPPDLPVSGDRVIGSVSFDGKKIAVNCLKGEVKVTNVSDNVSGVVLAVGERYDYEISEEDRSILAKLAEESEVAESVEAAESVPPPVQSKGLNKWALIGGGVAVVGLLIGLAGGGGGGGGGGGIPPASPSSP